MDKGEDRMNKGRDEEAVPQDADGPCWKLDARRRRIAGNASHTLATDLRAVRDLGGYFASSVHRNVTRTVILTADLTFQIGG